MSPSTPRAASHRQRGAATLIVVMVLFFIMAMMAAYANRNLLFEQRIASNYYRAGVALEVADSGLDWALTQLNGGNINAQCLPNNIPVTSFKDRYLEIDPATRKITPRQIAGTVADCVHVDGKGWTCQCPAVDTWTAAPAAPQANTMQPSFQISFRVEPSDPAGVVRVQSDGCTSSSINECINADAAIDASLGQAKVIAQLALVSALKMPPATPLTVAGDVTMDAKGLGLHNSDPSSSGLLLLAGGNAAGWVDARLDSLPGSSVQQALVTGDLTLSTAAAADKMFAMYFGMSLARYRAQPAARDVVCAADCSTALASAYAQGVRIAWIQGPATLSSNIILGTTAAPILIIVDGALTLNGPMQVNGVIYARGNIAWKNTSAQLALVNGALIGEGSMTSAGAVDLWYQGSVINTLNNIAGSFVRVPGSWFN